MQSTGFVQDKLTETTDAYLVFYPPGATGSDKALIASAVLLLKTEHVDAAKDERWLWLLIFLHLFGVLFVELLRPMIIMGYGGPLGFVQTQYIDHYLMSITGSGYDNEVGDSAVYWWLEVYCVTALIIIFFLYMENWWKYGELSAVCGVRSCTPACLRNHGSNKKFFLGSQALLGHHHVKEIAEHRGSRVTRMV